jgi:hypothetical protein
MKPRAILAVALLLVIIVLTIIASWATAGDRPGPMESAVFHQGGSQW